MSSIKDKLFKLQDKEYKFFQEKIISTVNPDTIIGVRTPELRKLAKILIKEDYTSFLKELPHKYFDENQLHAFIISEIKNYDDIDNWATCDQLSPKIFKKNTDKLLDHIKLWIKSKEPYIIRFGVGMLMQYYLDDNFNEEYLKMVSKIKSNEYYVNMMIAWYFATALAKQYKSTINYIENKKLDIWIHNKTIQKAVDSYRITEEQKEYLKSLKR